MERGAQVMSRWLRLLITEDRRSKASRPTGKWPIARLVSLVDFVLREAMRQTRKYRKVFS